MPRTSEESLESLEQQDLVQQVEWLRGAPRQIAVPPELRGWQRAPAAPLNVVDVPPGLNVMCQPSGSVSVGYHEHARAARALMRMFVMLPPLLGAMGRVRAIAVLMAVTTAGLMAPSG